MDTFVLKDSTDRYVVISKSDKSASLTNDLNEATVMGEHVRRMSLYRRLISDWSCVELPAREVKTVELLQD